MLVDDAIKDDLLVLSRRSLIELCSLLADLSIGGDRARLELVPMPLLSIVFGSDDAG